MKAARLVVTIALLLFVGATVGTLVAKEVARPETTRIADGSDSSTMTDETTTVVDPEPAVTEEPEPSGVETPDEEEAPGDTACVIEAIYFHNTYRCVTCLKIEGDAKAIVEKEFAEELAAGKLRWSTIDMEENRSYISQYDLASPSLVLIRKAGDDVVDWITLKDTWNLIRSETRFAPYIVDSFQAFLEGCP